MRGFRVVLLSLLVVIFVISSNNILTFAQDKPIQAASDIDHTVPASVSDQSGQSDESASSDQSAQSNITPASADDPASAAANDTTLIPDNPAATTTDTQTAPETGTAPEVETIPAAETASTVEIASAVETVSDPIDEDASPEDGLANQEDQANQANPSIDTTRSANGVIRVRYYGDKAIRSKLTIEKGGKKYSYNLSRGMEYESFPLQMGSGEYKICVLESVGGDRYKIVSSDTYDFSINNANGVYLNSVQNINWNPSMKAIKKAEELTKGLSGDEAKIKAVYEYIISNFSYDHAKLAKLTYAYLPDIDQMYTSRKGICYDYSSIFAAMLRSIGIPTKLVKGYTPSVQGYHAWNEVYMKSTGKWVTIDTTADAQYRLTKKSFSMIKQAGTYQKVNEY